MQCPPVHSKAKLIPLKFRFSEKATRILSYLPSLLLTLQSEVKSKRKTNPNLLWPSQKTLTLQQVYFCKKEQIAYSYKYE